MNVGKKFEEDFLKSAPSTALFYRLHDSAQAFGGNSSLRFSSKNPFDYIIWDSTRRNLYALELKTVAGSSISFERSKDEKGEIHYHQIVGLRNWAKFGVISGFIIFFRKLEITVFIDIAEFDKLIAAIPKKSFNYADLDKHFIKYTVIEQTKKRTRYTYNLEKFLKGENEE